MKRRTQRALLGEALADRGRPHTTTGYAVTPVEHWHVYLRDFFSGVDVDGGYFTDPDSAVEAGRAMIVTYATATVSYPGRDFGHDVALITMSGASTTARVRRCDDPDCRQAAVASRLHEDR